MASTELRLRRYDQFVTPIWRTDSSFTDADDVLVTAVRRLRDQDPKGRKASNRGGWQSALLHGEEFAGIAEYFLAQGRAALSDWGLDLHGLPLELNALWANINKGQDINLVHHHWSYPIGPVNLLAGAYYLRASPGSGNITFCDERPSSWLVMLDPFVKPPNRFLDDRFSIHPEPGTLLLFPAWLQHRVEPSRDEAERISLSFNLCLRTDMLDQHGEHLPEEAT